MSEDNTLENMIDYAANADFNKANAIFNDMIAQKMDAAIDQERIAVAGKIFNDIEDEELEAEVEAEVLSPRAPLLCRSAARLPRVRVAFVLPGQMATLHAQPVVQQTTNSADCHPCREMELITAQRSRQPANIWGNSGRNGLPRR